MTRRSYQTTFFIAFLCVATAAMTFLPATPEVRAQEAPPQLVVLEESEPQTTYPFKARTMAEQRLAELLFDRLFIQGSGGDIESKVLAEGWQARPPTLTFTLKDGLTFSDGSAVSFADVAFTVNNVYRRQDVGVSLAAWYARVFGDARQITPSTGSVRFLVEMPEEGSEQYLLTTALLSQKALSSAGTVDFEESRRQPVGTGPFHAASPIDNFDDVRLERNPHRPVHKRVSTKEDREPIEAMRLLYDQDAARQRELMEGSRADVWVNPPPAVLPTFRNQRERYAVRAYDLNQWWYVAVNPAHPILGKPAVRKALDMAVPRDQLVTKFGSESATPTSGPFLPGSAWTPTDVSHTAYEPEKAATLLSSTELGDAKLEIRLGVQADLLDDYNDVVYGTISGWEDLGFRVRVRGISPADWFAKVEGGDAAAEYDALLGRWNLDREEAALELFRTRTTGQTTNLFGWSNEEVESLLKDFYGETSGPKREALMQKLHRLVGEERPYLFLWTVQVQSVVRRDKVVGFRPSPFYYYTDIDRAAWKKAPQE